MSTNGDRDIVEKLSKEDLLSYNKLVGHTPFSFFRDFTHPVVIFNYYEDFALKLVNDICIAINQQFETEFEYLVNPEVNAGCMYLDGKNKIIVYEGTILSIYSFAAILSCNYRTVLMKTDSSIGRVVHTININTQYPNYPTITTQLNISSISEENIIAEYIAMIAIKFIISHEIGHILSGHLIYRLEHGEANASFYMTGNNADSIDNLDLQAMEIDADNFAICQLMSLLETELLDDKLLLDTVSDISEIYKLVGCAIQCVFYLVGVNKNQWIEDNPLGHSHPPSLTRVNLLLDICRGTLSGENADQKFRNIIQGIILAQKNLCNFFKKDFYAPEQFVLDILGKNDYGMLVLDHWRNLKMSLSNYTTLPFV